MSVLQQSDWYTQPSILHPVAVGGATLVVVWLYMRLASQRSMNPNSLFSWMCSVAIGSTVSRILTTPDINFVRGLLSLAMLFLAEWVTTFLQSNLSPKFSHIFKNPPIMLVFRGDVDTVMMKRHRVAPSGLMQALRQSGKVRLSQVEAIILESNGSFSVIPLLEGEARDEPFDALDQVPTYAKRCRESLGEDRWRKDEPQVRDLRSKQVTQTNATKHHGLSEKQPPRSGDQRAVHEMA